MAEHPAEGKRVSNSRAAGWRAKSDAEMSEGKCHSGPEWTKPCVWKVVKPGERGICGRRWGVTSSPPRSLPHLLLIIHGTMLSTSHAFLSFQLGLKRTPLLYGAMGPWTLVPMCEMGTAAPFLVTESVGRGGSSALSGAHWEQLLSLVTRSLSPWASTQS